MFHSIRILLFAVFSNFLVITSCSQENNPPFHDEIQTFLSQDRQSPPPENGIVFVGSSSFKMWEDVKDYFPGYPIINRGFGGSGLNDVIRYVNKIVIPYNPKQVVIYCGENDIASGSVTSADVLQRFNKLFNLIRQKLPEARMAFVSLKPSPSREKYLAVMEESNIMIKKFLSDQPNTAYIDVFHPMLDKDGRPRPELFIEDMLHMNKQGYAIWQKAIEQHLIK